MKKNNRKKNYKSERKVSAFEERKKFCPFSQINSPVIDYKDGLMDAGFTINIPSAKNSCGCGDSFSM